MDFLILQRFARQYSAVLTASVLIPGFGLLAWGQTGTGTGLKAEYFGNISLTTPVALSRTDSTVNFEWNTAAPAPGVPADNYSVRWSGQVEAPVTGSYTFSTRSDDGIRLWIGGKLQVNNWSDHSPRFDQSLPIVLTAGKKYDVQIEYYERAGGATAQLWWRTPGQTKDEIVPQIRLYPVAITLQPVPPQTSRVWVSDLNWLTATNGLGPAERDRANGLAPAGDGKTLSLAGRKYGKGIGTASPSDIRIALDDRFDLFRAVIGIDDEVADAGSAVFEVWLDGKRVYQSPVIKGSDPGLTIEVPVEDAKEMRLVVTNGGDNGQADHADWADAHLEGVESTRYLSDLTWLSATPAGVTLKDKPSGGATKFLLRGATWQKGLGTVPGSEIRYDLTRKYERLSAIVGIDDAAKGAGSAIFEIWSGATRLYRSSMLKGTSPPEHVSISLKDKDELTLKVLDGGDGIAGDLADWADVRLLPIGSDVNVQAPAAPPALTATAGVASVTLDWDPADRATAYNVFRGTASGEEGIVPIAANVTTTGFNDKNLTIGTKYFYRVRSLNAGGVSSNSREVSATPVPAPPATPPSGFSATAGNAQVKLAWTPIDGITKYAVFRGTAHNGQSATPIATVTGASYTNTGLTNGTPYFYKVAAMNAGGAGALSAEVSATPLAPPAAPATLSAVKGDKQIVLSWTASPTATSYRVYRGTTSGNQSNTPIAIDLTTTAFTNVALVNGTTYFYKVSAVNGTGEGVRSVEASATPVTPRPVIDPAMISAFRLLRQATWGPKPGDVERIKSMTRDAFVTEQMAMPASTYPDTLFNMSLESTQEHFMQLALTGPDQLRQRVAWALHKIMVVSGVEVGSPSAIVPYQRILMNRAFGNYRDLMRDITLNPAMGRYLNMLNNRSQAITGELPNENFARELLQLFTLGIPVLRQDGSIVVDGLGKQVNVYTEEDVKALARIFTGWTFGDGNPVSIPTNLAAENYRVPMEPVERFHDTGAKTFLGVNFAPNQTATADLDKALDLIFNHANIGPFVSRQLIQMLVTSNPSPQYISDVVAVFNNNGSGVRGDLAAVVRKILTHADASLGTATSGKFMEPALFTTSMLRTLNAQVVDHPFMSDKSEEMGQKVFYPPSVFSYFSPGFRVRNTPLGGPEFQILTTVTTLVRTNFVGELLSGRFGADVKVDYSQFISRAPDPEALADYCNVLLMGGLMPENVRTEIVKAIAATPQSNTTERLRTGIYLTLTSALYQTDH